MDPSGRSTGTEPARQDPHAACQRWRFGRESRRLGRTVVEPRALEVAAIGDDTTARSFVEAHHYARSYPAARFRFGLYTRSGDLVGVAVFSHPVNDRVLSGVFATPILEAVELGRFVLLDEVPANAETWFLARCFRALRAEGIAGVVAFSDPVARTRSDGSIVHPGHVGWIYQAGNAHYLGRGTPRTLRLLPDGTVLHERALQKVRAGERGAAGVARRLERASGGESTLAAQLRSATRTLRHPGNHRYGWAFGRSAFRPEIRPFDYPKRLEQDALQSPLFS